MSPTANEISVSSLATNSNSARARRPLVVGVGLATGADTTAVFTGEAVVVVLTGPEMTGPEILVSAEEFFRTGEADPGAGGSFFFETPLEKKKSLKKKKKNQTRNL